jgi:hypothetical protein
MSKPIGIAPASRKGVTFNLCSGCQSKTPQSTGCCTRPSCKTCRRTMRFMLQLCSVCSNKSGNCQLCGSSIAAKAVQAVEKPATKGRPKKGPLSLMPYIEAEARKAETDVDSWLADYADGVSEGYGAREESAERRCIRLARETSLVAEEITRIRTVLGENNYGTKTQNIAIGEFILEVREQAKAAKAAKK